MSIAVAWAAAGGRAPGYAPASLRALTAARIGAVGFGPGRVLLRHLATPSAYAIGGALYVSDTTPSGVSTLSRVNPATGAIGATLSLERVNVDAVLLGEGWLWATINPWKPTRPSWLLRLEPNTLEVLSRTRLSEPVSDDLAIAGSSLWVGDGGDLDQVATIGGTIIARVPVPGAKQISVASSEHGEALFVSEGDGSGRAYVERRDPYTGALDARSSRFLGVSVPRLGGTAMNGLWLSEATGMQGYVERLDLEHLVPLRADLPPLEETNGVHADVIDGILWITQPGGGPTRNYCGDPVTGRPRMPLPSVISHGEFLTADSARVYYLNGLGQGSLLTARIPAGCR